MYWCSGNFSINPLQFHWQFNSLFNTIHYFNLILINTYTLGQKKKCLCCPLPTDRKMRKNRVGFFFFFFFMSDLGEEFAKSCIQWLKKALCMTCTCVLTAFRPSFPHLETLKKILENSTLSLYVKKKKKKNPDRPTQFFNFGRVRAT